MTSPPSLDEGREEWLAWRRRGIGGSDIAPVLGISPFDTPMTVWLSKVEGIDSAETEAMRWGRLLEDVIADQVAEERLDWKIGGAQTMAVHPDHPHERATLDREVTTNDTTGALELKCTGERTEYGERVLDDPNYVPVYYLAQGQWQCHVGGYPFVVFAVLVGGRYLRISDPVPHDPDLCDDLHQAATAFWQDYVETETPPPADIGPADVTRDALRGAFLADEATDPIVLDSRQIQVLDQLRAAKRELALVEADVAACQAELMAGMRDHVEGVDPATGETVITWRPTTELDIDALRKDHGHTVALHTDSVLVFDAKGFTKAHRDLAKRYRRPTGRRQFRTP